MREVLRVGQPRDERAKSSGVEADPDREADQREEKKDHWKPAARAGQIGPSLKRVSAGQHHMPGSGKDEHPLKQEDEHEEPE